MTSPLNLDLVSISSFHSLFSVNSVFNMKQWTHPCQILTLHGFRRSLSAFPRLASFFFLVYLLSLFSQGVQEEVRVRTGGRSRGTEGWRERQPGGVMAGGGAGRAMCRYFRIRWSPSPRSSVEKKKKKKLLIRRKTYPHSLKLFPAGALLTFDSGDQKTALVREVVNHLWRRKSSQ